ncbi:hypothetical protein R1flu_000250 [Riccia fluitans]|uniref:Uncharacterized protein n=1 Tax=Riccia fluitans TaxID=41844 RepID=A0ABD1Y0C7_9MARC
MLASDKNYTGIVAWLEGKMVPISIVCGVTTSTTSASKPKLPLCSLVATCSMLSVLSFYMMDMWKIHNATLPPNPSTPPPIRTTVEMSRHPIYNSLMLNLVPVSVKFQAMSGSSPVCLDTVATTSAKVFPRDPWSSYASRKDSGDDVLKVGPVSVGVS